MMGHPRSGCRRLSWDSTTPLGCPVVPEVYIMIAGSAPRPLATSAAKKPGLAFAQARPASRSDS
jgi:hypothetical protein